MMMSEFEERTGFYPSQDLYGFIENAYNESNLDKDTFCNAYMTNKDGLAEGIARKASLARISSMDVEKKTVAALESDIERLKAQLEMEQGWEPYESKHNVTQELYEKLACCDSTRTLTDEEAIDLITREFGFDPGKITILHTVGKEEISRNRRIRTVGEIERLPKYNATDWNYIRFDCSCWYYEMYNGQLCQFYN